MLHNDCARTRLLVSALVLLIVLFSVAPAYAAGVSDIEYENNGLTPTEQQAGDSGGWSLNPLEWDWGGIGDFLGDLWDGTLDVLDAIGGFLSDLGEMIGDLWDSLPDWAQDLIITIGIVVAAVVGVIALVVAGVISAVVAAVAIIAAVVAGIVYFAMYGGTDAFNPLHAAGWIFGSALLGGGIAFLAEIGAISALGSAIVNGVRALGPLAARLGHALWGGMRSLGLRAWGAIRIGFTRAWGAISSGFARMWGGIQAGFSRMWGAIAPRLTRLWGGMKGAFRWAGSYISRYWRAGLYSAFATMAIDGFKILFLGESFNVWHFLGNAGLSALFGFFAGPIAGSIKSAFVARNWRTLAGWAGAGGLLGGLGNFMGEFMKGGGGWQDIVVGTLAGFAGLPFAAMMSDASMVVTEFGADVLTKIVEEFAKWGSNLPFSDIMTGVVDNVTQFGSNMWDSISGWFSD